MKSKSCTRLLITAAALATGLAPLSGAEILFEDSFSGDLSSWTGKLGGGHQGQIVADPLVPGNHVLNFSGFNWSGDIFSGLINTSGHSGIILSFDYLGLAVPGSNAGNLGGFVGISDSLDPQASGAAWVAGTEPSAVNGLGQNGIEILDDGIWHHYEIELTQLLANNNISAFRVMLEDWGDAGGVAGDAYFDNVKVQAVPDTTGNVALSMAAGGLLLLHRRFRSQSYSA